MSDCIIWTKSTNSSGYGNATFEGKTVGAHRLAFFQVNGYWPNVCRHACDNPACVNPTHLSDGTQLDNIRDSVERGRHVSAPLLNHDMPNQYEDAAAYQRELRRRQKDGTWVYRTMTTNESEGNTNG